MVAAEVICSCIRWANNISFTWGRNSSLISKIDFP